MSQPELTLFHMPGACSRVSVCALEMAELDYTLELVNIPKGAQHEAAYQKINPLGKVPALVIDGRPLYESVGILTYIALLRPDKGVFPVDDSPRALADSISALAFCSGSVHPVVRGIFAPNRVTTGDEEGVRERSTELAKKVFKYAEGVLEGSGFWFEQPSIIDVYLDWTLFTGIRGNFDTSPFPLLSSLSSRLAAASPAYARMQVEEKESRAKLGLG